MDDEQGYLSLGNHQLVAFLMFLWIHLDPMRSSSRSMACSRVSPDVISYSAAMSSTAEWFSGLSFWCRNLYFDPFFMNIWKSQISGKQEIITNPLRKLITSPDAGPWTSLDQVPVLRIFSGVLLCSCSHRCSSNSPRTSLGDLCALYPTNRKKQWVIPPVIGPIMGWTIG